MIPEQPVPTETSFRQSLAHLPGNVWRSFVRIGWPRTDRERAAIVVNNLILHVHPPRVHWHSLQPTYTLGLGLITLALFLILCLTGVLLMFYYTPAVPEAYGKMQDLAFVVSFGRVVRNLHRWTAHGMVIACFLHTARVFYTAAYKPPRELNWVVGVTLLVLTLGLSYTGYLLPWDQLALWAITVGTNVISYLPLLGDELRFLLLGADTVGPEALLRFYVLHVAVLPVLAAALMGYHFWRIRKDGGLARPPDGPPPSLSEACEECPALTQADAQQTRLAAARRRVRETTLSFPRLIYIESLVLLGVLVVFFVPSILFDAPLLQIANAEHPPNPAKAPWYFLGIQELVSYSAFWGGVVVPALIIMGLLLLPYLDRDQRGVGVWFARERRTIIVVWTVLNLAGIILTLVGAYLRGPNWGFYWPWQGWPGPD